MSQVHFTSMQKKEANVRNGEKISRLSKFVASSGNNLN